MKATATNGRETSEIENLHITVDKEGANAYSKVSYPLRYGRYAEVRTPEYVFQFNLNGEVKFISGRGKDWPDPSEWLKRTITDEWVYYSTGGYSSLYDCFGEYYVPCLSYPSNTIISYDPFNDKAVTSAIKAWERLHNQLTELNAGSLPGRTQELLELVILNSPAELRRRSSRIHEITGDNITVLPPDTRHVDYEVIPIIIADGCLYRCSFCRVKSPLHFKERSREDIKEQIQNLKAFFDKDINNYCSVFLGQHDALNSSTDLIEYAAGLAFEAFDLSKSNLKDPSLFLFGSVNSIMKSDDGLFERLNRLPFKTYINIGLESADQETLDWLGKCISKEAVEKAFVKIMEINREYENIEITSNFVFGSDLPGSHIKSFARLIENSLDRPFHKGTIYFSPLIGAKSDQSKGNIKREFYKLKMSIPVPSYLYLIQRL